MSAMVLKRSDSRKKCQKYQLKTQVGIGLTVRSWPFADCKSSVLSLIEHPLYPQKRTFG